MYSPEALRELALLQQKALSGDYTIDDMRRYVEISRTDREAAQASTAASKRKTKTKVNVDDLIESLGKI